MKKYSHFFSLYFSKWSRDNVIKMYEKEKNMLKIIGGSIRRFF